MFEIMKKLENTYTNKSMVVLNKYSKQYKDAKNKYNEKALHIKKDEVLNLAKKELEDIKKEYIKQGNLEIDKKLNEYKRIKDNPPKPNNIQEAILEQLKISNDMRRFEAKYKILSGDSIVQRLLDGNIDNEYEFDIAKSVAYEKVENTEGLSQCAYMSPIDKQINEASKYKTNLQVLEMNSEKYLTGFVNSVYEYITGESIADYYFKK